RRHRSSDLKYRHDLEEWIDSSVDFTSKEEPATPSTPSDPDEGTWLDPNWQFTNLKEVELLSVKEFFLANRRIPVFVIIEFFLGICLKAIRELVAAAREIFQPRRLEKNYER